ncbi:MAG: nucleotidyltransferase domain-containing protein [Anaerolineae bacterium]|nr:nucleotidyltransferase domain-containing protein [Anaerolineae bacterium]
MIPRSESTITTYRQHFKAQQAKKLEEREAKRLYALETVTAVLPPIISQFPTIQQLFLFGSIVHPGQFHAKSDIDIGVLGTTAEDYFALWRELEAKLPEWIIDLRDISDDSFFANTVQKTGLLIYERANKLAKS